MQLAGVMRWTSLCVSEVKYQVTGVWVGEREGVYTYSHA